MQVFYKIYDLGEIPDPGHVKNEDISLSFPNATLTGIQLSGDNRVAVLRRGTLRMELNGQEVFPEGFPAESLLSGVQVAPDDRYYTLDLPVGSGNLKFRYIDVDNPLTPHTPYTPKINLRFEQP